MNDSPKIYLSEYAQKKYGVSGSIDFKTWVNYCGVLLVISGADGELAEEELNWLIKEQTSYGATEEIIQAIQSFDWKAANLEELLATLMYEFSINARRTLLYQAITMSRADGVYHKEEKKAIWNSAKMLGVEPSVVSTLESLVEMEETVNKLRYSVLETIAHEA